MAGRAQDWLSQVENDLEFARHAARGGYHAQCCFICQQVGEKALKALALLRGYDFAKTHSVRLLAQQLKIDGEIEKAGKKLDKYYISGRYPDAFPEGAPYQFFTKEEADEALELASFIVQEVKGGRLE